MSEELAEQCIVALDLETTGLSVNRDRIVEFAAVRWRHGVIEGEFAALVQPGRPIPYHATLVHGITDEMVADSPAIADVLPAFLDFCQADLLVAHNAKFDLGFLDAACARAELPLLSVPVVDSCTLARERLPGCPNYRLETLKSVLQLGQGQAHRALEDARDCLAVFLACTHPDAPTLHLPVPPASPLPGEYHLLTATFDDGGTIHIEYEDTRGHVTHREVRPLGVSRNGDAIVLEAHCYLRGEKRHFSLSRIRRMWRA